MAKTTTAKINSWFKSAVGRSMNPDHAFGLQCKDTIDDYAQHLYGTPWHISIKPGNGGKVFDNAPSEYWTKIKNNPKDPNLIPKKGDIVCYPGRASNAWFGHIAVVESASKVGVTVIQQDGFLQKPAHRKYISYASYLPMGWLRPKVSDQKPAAKPAPVKQKAVYVTVKKGWGLSHVAKAAGFKDAGQSSRWQAISKLNGNSDWRKFNAGLKPGQKVRVK